MRVKIKMDPVSINKLEGNLSKALLGAQNIGNMSMIQVAESIMNESQQEVPVDTGTLESAAFIEQTSKGVRFGYGGPSDKVNPKSQQEASSYMYFVHEDPTKKHDIGKWKFLEDPVNRHKDLFTSGLSRALSKFFGKL